MLTKLINLPRKLSLKLLWVYQTYITKLAGNNCRYYPSCSEYARLQFKNNPLPFAFYASAKRILSCNQLFIGGIDYPKLLKVNEKPSTIRVKSIKYWLVPDKEGHYHIIKNFFYKG